MNWVKATTVIGGKHIYIRSTDIGLVEPSGEGQRLWVGDNDTDFFHVRETAAEIFDQITGKVSKLPTRSPEGVPEAEAKKFRIQGELAALKHFKVTFQNYIRTAHLCGGDPSLDIPRQLQKRIDELEKACDSKA